MLNIQTGTNQGPNMKIDVSGHHVDITPGITESINTKLTKVATHYPDLAAASVIVTVERNEQKIEIKTQYRGIPVSVSASDNELYVAIAAASKKFEAALSKRKGSLTANRHDTPDLIVEPEED
jgi:ribosomal subunit interface protein